MIVCREYGNGMIVNVHRQICMDVQAFIGIKSCSFSVSGRNAPAPHLAVFQGYRSSLRSEHPSTGDEVRHHSEGLYFDIESSEAVGDI